MASTAAFEAIPTNLESLWMPFTSDRQFKAKPRFFVGAKDMHHTTMDSRRMLDKTAGLWCINPGQSLERGNLP